MSIRNRVNSNSGTAKSEQSVDPEPQQLAPLTPGRAVRDKAAASILGVSRSHFWALQNPNCSSFDETVPKRFKLGRGPNAPTVWWEHELIAWLQARAAASVWR